MTEYSPKTNLPLDAITKSTPLDGIQQSFRIDSYDRVDNRGIDISVATGQTPEEVNTKVTNGDNSPIQEAKNSVGDVVGDTVNNAIANNEDQQAAASKILDTQEKKSGMDRFSDFILEDALTVDDPNYNPRLANLYRNQQIAFEVMAERFKGAQEKGVVGTTLDFVDRYLLRQIGIGTYEDITRRSERKGLELAQAAADMDGDEYREYISNYADELAEEGIFRGDNWFAYQDGLNEAVNAGYDVNAGFNQIMGATDLLGLGALAKAPLRGAGKVVTRVGKVKGVKAADEAVERLSEAGARSHPEVQDELMPSAQSITKDDLVVGPTQSRTNEIFHRNKLVQEVQELAKSGSFGRMATKAEIDSLAGQISARLAKTSSRPLANYDVVDRTGLGDMAVQVKVGKISDGTPYKSETTATTAAKSMQEKSGLATKVVKVDEDDISKGFYVEVEEAMDLTRTANAVDVAGVTENILARALGSTRAVDDLKLNTLANMSESGQGAIRERVLPYLKPLEKLKYDSKVALGKVYRELRDGQDAYIRDGYTEAEFRQKFKQHHPKGREATDKDIDAFYAAQTLNDTAYILEANRLASRYVAKGYKGVQIGDAHVPAKRITEALPDDTRLIDGATNRSVYSQDVTDDVAIFKLDRTVDDIEYVVRPKNVRSIQYEDVLSYNAGGRRINPDAKYFATTKDNRALFTAFSEKQVMSGVDDINTLMRAARAAGKQLDELVDELDGLIPSRNKWNPDIENTADFVAWLGKKGIRTTDDISYKARDGIVEDAGDLYNGMNMAEYQRAANGRSDEVLMEYGGKETFNENPIKAMVDQFSEASAEYSFRNYNYNAKTAWLKKALRVDTLPEGTDVNALFRETAATGGGATDRKLRILRGVIERRESLASPAVGAMQDYGKRLEEFVFDKTGAKIKTGGAEGALLNIGFQSAFGFLNVSQFFLQATHAVSIVAISPKAGSEAAAMVIPMRAAMHSGSEAAKKLAYKRMAKVSTLSAEDFADYDKYLRTSGRDLVENDAIEKGTGAGFGVSWWEGSSLLPESAQKAGGVAARGVKKASDVGLFFFNEGERLSRHTGIMTAFIEHRRLFPNVKPLSDEGRAWITRREQDLTLNMTTASRGAWQSGLLKVPTQWLSYSMRTMEALVFGGGLSKGERVRLGLMMTAMGGTAGFGANKLADYAGEAFGVEPDSIAYTTIKYGIADAFGSWAISGLTGEEVRTAFGTRIAPLTAFTDLYRKVTEESTVSALAGPSGEIAGGLANAGLNALMGGVDLIVNGDGYGRETFMKDMERVLRTPSAVDNWFKAREMAMTGVYRSKTGTTLPMEFSDVEAIMQGIGVTNFKVAEYYDRKGKIWRSEKEARDFTKQLQSDFRLALAKYERDPAAGRKFMDEIGARIEFSGFSPLVKSQMRRNLARSEGNGVVDMALKLISEGNDYGASVIESLN